MTVGWPFIGELNSTLTLVTLNDPGNIVNVSPFLETETRSRFLSRRSPWGDTTPVRKSSESPSPNSLPIESDVTKLYAGNVAFVRSWADRPKLVTATLNPALISDESAKKKSASQERPPKANSTSSSSSSPTKPRIGVANIARGRSIFPLYVSVNVKTGDRSLNAKLGKHFASGRPSVCVGTPHPLRPVLILLMGESPSGNFSRGSNSTLSGACPEL
mmetsp:Transcript_21121/g.49583  ORF Transcript_21121/g.49583 Transcript_21121/m.49583 type:complete len:217 (+) Transcript_21121:481-1131(+)